MLKVSTAGDGLLAKCRVIPAGNDKTISPMIFTTHLRKRRESNTAWKTAERETHTNAQIHTISFAFDNKTKHTVLMRFCYWLNYYIKSSANHSSHIITAVKPRSEAKSITHQFILIHNSEQCNKSKLYLFTWLCRWKFNYKTYKTGFIVTKSTNTVLMCL